MLSNSKYNFNLTCRFSRNVLVNLLSAFFPMILREIKWTGSCVTWFLINPPVFFRRQYTVMSSEEAVLLLASCCLSNTCVCVSARSIPCWDSPSSSSTRAGQTSWWGLWCRRPSSSSGGSSAQLTSPRSHTIYLTHTVVTLLPAPLRHWWTPVLSTIAQQSTRNISALTSLLFDLSPTCYRDDRGAVLPSSLLSIFTIIMNIFVLSFYGHFGVVFFMVV